MGDRYRVCTSRVMVERTCLGPKKPSSSSFSAEGVGVAVRCYVTQTSKFDLQRSSKLQLDSRPSSKGISETFTAMSHAYLS